MAASRKRGYTRGVIFSRIDYFDDRQPHPAALNMALDEALLKAARHPILRLYQWERPSVSFGYFERFAPVAARYPAMEPVRRWTGGGAVEHGEDTTYSIIVPVAEATFHRFSPADSYCELHAVLVETMAECGITAVVGTERANAVSNACFENPVRHDVMIDGRKVAGAAQRRTRWGLLHQGSIQRVTLSADFGSRFAARLAPAVQPFALGPDVGAEAQLLAAEKYGASGWLRRL